MARYWVAGLGLALFTVIFWLSYGMVLLFFAGVLAALLLRGAAKFVAAHTPLSCGWSLLVVVLTLMALGIGLGWLLAPEINQQAQMLATEFPKALEHARNEIKDYPWGPAVIRASTDVQQTIWRVPAGIVSSLAGFLSGVIVVVFVGLYMASEPRLYTEGFLRLFPRERRGRVREILQNSGTTLQWWLLGQLSLMTLNAIVTTIGLLLLGVPMAVTLGVLSGILNFVPTFGPIIAAIPAVLLALTDDPMKAVQVAAFYFAYQMFDGYVLTPWVHRHSVYLPPALTIMAQVTLGALLGAMGVVFAVPLVALGLTIVKMAYVEDVLGENVKLPADG